MTESEDWTEPASSSEPEDRTQSEDRAEPTGVPAADEAHARLSTVDDAPLEEHVEVYEDVHRQLQEGLADLDET